MERFSRIYKRHCGDFSWCEHRGNLYSAFFAIRRVNIRELWMWHYCVVRCFAVCFSQAEKFRASRFSFLCLRKRRISIGAPCPGHSTARSHTRSPNALAFLAPRLNRSIVFSWTILEMQSVEEIFICSADRSWPEGKEASHLERSFASLNWFCSVRYLDTEMQ